MDKGTFTEIPLTNGPPCLRQPANRVSTRVKVCNLALISLFALVFIMMGRTASPVISSSGFPSPEPLLQTTLNHSQTIPEKANDSVLFPTVLKSEENKKPVNMSASTVRRKDEKSVSDEHVASEHETNDEDAASGHQFVVSEKNYSSSSSWQNQPTDAISLAILAERRRQYGNVDSWKMVLDNDVKVVQACDEGNSNNSFIYCYGRLLEAVNSLGLFADSKTFVDMPLKFSPNEVRRKFDVQFPILQPEKLDRPSLEKFVAENFNREGTELMTCTLGDWNENPAPLMDIQDQTLKEWALELNKIWRKLCRQIKPEVQENPDRYSLIYVPKPFVAPGGRFREFYYWDAYWIIKGLLVSGMLDTAKHMIENFLYMVETYGFVPNGGRVYYLRRSQPPLLAAMVYEYYEATHDFSFLSNALPILEKELKFWETNRTVDVEIDGRNLTVFQFRADSNVPRPESYREDRILVNQLTKPSDKHKIWHDIASAAESGWDFSTRWLKDPENPNLVDIETTDIAEVDLNAFLCWNYDIMSYLFLEMDNEMKSNEYRDKHYIFRNIFRKVFYVWDRDNDKAAWYDYNLRRRQHNKQFYPSVAVPLFTRCYRPINIAQSQRIFRTMEALGVFKYPGGVPTSGQQWDWPNGWPPSNHMIIEGLRRSGHPLMQQKAFWLAEKWVLANYRVYKKTHSAMWEKYNVIGSTPDLGSGGEYDVQAGFGWTNGVILDLLTTYGDRMYFHNLEDDPTAVAHKVINSEPKYEHSISQATDGNEMDDKQMDGRQRDVVLHAAPSLLNSASAPKLSSLTISSIAFFILVTSFLHVVLSSSAVHSRKI